MPARSIHILYVEDNPGDIRLVKEALRLSAIPNQLHAVSDGTQALAFLRRESPFGECPRPHLILLDLNLPRRDGREVLAEIKQDPSLRALPVIVLTSSESEQDIRRCYDLHANCYIAKPVDLEHFMEVVQTIEKFWLNLAKLPPD